jgi:hypothetical protein
MPAAASAAVRAGQRGGLLPDTDDRRRDGAGRDEPSPGAGWRRRRAVRRGWRVPRGRPGGVPRDGVDRHRGIPHRVDVRERRAPVLVDDEPHARSGAGGSNTAVSGRTPTERTTMSASRRVPSLEHDDVGRRRTRWPRPRQRCAPGCRGAQFAVTSVASSSSSGSTWGANSTIVVSRPWCASASAASTPMKPAPRTTARRAPPSTR